MCCCIFSLFRPVEESCSPGCADVEFGPAEIEVDESVSDNDMDVENLAAEFICKSEHMSSSLSVANDVVFSCSLLVETVVSKLEARVLQVLSKVGVNVDSGKVRQLVDEFNQHKNHLRKWTLPIRRTNTGETEGFLAEPKNTLLEYANHTILTRQRAWDFLQANLFQFGKCCKRT